MEVGNMQIEQLYRNIVSEEMNNEAIEERIRWMISGIKSIEVQGRLIIEGLCDYSTLGKTDTYNQYKNIEVPVDGYLVYDTIGHTGEYFIQAKDNLMQVEQALLGPDGLNNMFTTEMLVLWDGKIKRYHVINKEGTVLTKTQIECIPEKEVSELKVIWISTE